MKRQQPKYPALAKSYKGMFPFKICTTSFIYPDHYIPNVRMLGPYMDEIELLLFESQKADSIPSKAVIAELGQMGREFGLSYNVHLPTDIFISDRNSERQKIALETMARTIDRVNPLDPSALILHLPYCEKSFSDPDVRNWQNRVFQNLSKLISAVQSNKIIAIETLEYLLDRYTLHIVTNGFLSTQQIKMKNCGLDKYFSSLTTSEVVGHNKPRPEIFHHALSAVHARKQESIMVGDDLEVDVLGARNFGIDQVFLNREGIRHKETITHEIESLADLKDLL